MNQPAAHRVRLTTLAHRLVAGVLTPGDSAIDATAGNGGDTEHLARLVGSSGKVLAIDIQADAIAITRHRLAEAGQENVQLVQANHAELADLAEAWPGEVGAVMFNLGYLPHGDPEIKTTAQSSTIAIQAATELLCEGGIVTILVYTGHPGGSEERQAVERLLNALPERFACDEHASESGSVAGPHLFVVRREG